MSQTLLPSMAGGEDSERPEIPRTQHHCQWRPQTLDQGLCGKGLWPHSRAFCEGPSYCVTTVTTTVMNPAAETGQKRKVYAHSSTQSSPGPEKPGLRVCAKTLGF